MTRAFKPLMTQIAADLMSPTIVTIPQDMSLRGAARLLAQADVSGAPVVDPAGRCIGVLSARDFVAWAERGPEAAKRQPRTNECFCSDWKMMSGDALPDEIVECYMTADPVTVSHTTHIGTLAQMMVDARIHRVIVVDRIGRPVGVVSSTDVLAAVARAAQAHGADASVLADAPRLYGSPSLGREDRGEGDALEESEHDPFHSRAT